MGLSSALATAMTGLRANQAALSIISGNVANAQTPGYVTQNPNQIEVNSGGEGSTVLTTGVSRQLDLFVQNQLRTEISGGAYADQTANILGQLQSVYGTPGGDGTLETTLNNFTTALQALSSNPGNQSAQSVALSAPQTLAQQLNTTTRGIQSLRSNVDQDIGNSAAQANTDMSQIAQINTQLQGLSPTDPEAATLMDQRDNALSQLAKLVDVRAVTDSSNQTNVFTTSGIQLVGAGLASEFTFNSPGTLGATSLYSANPAKSGVGALNLRLPNGAAIDLVATNAISSGQIGADLKLRDQTLVQAQTQVDQMAATMSSALSDKTTAGTAVAGPPSGVGVNAASVTTTLTSLASGNPQLPLFTDASSIYTGQITASGSEMTGLAGRISVNAALLADPTKLSVYNTSPLTATGDTKRSDFLYAQLTSATFSCSPSTGIGSSAQPFQGTVTSYLQQFINQQSNASTLATQLQQGQSVVVSTLQQKFSSTASVNIDTEMSNLIAVQNAYAANAHIMSVVQSMMNTLLQAQV